MNEKEVRSILEFLVDDVMSDRGTDKEIINKALASLDALFPSEPKEDKVVKLQVEFDKYKENTLRLITGDCDKVHNSTFDDIVKLGCPICKDAELSSARDGNTFQKKRYYSLKARMEVGEKAFWFKVLDEGEKVLWLCFEGGMVNLNHIASQRGGGITEKNMKLAIVKHLRGEKV